MPSHPRPTHRGLTLLELVLAITVTAMVAAAIASMLAAVTAGVVTKRDARSLMVHASAAQTRLEAYVAPSRCALDAGGSTLVLWLKDSRKSETIQATEIRWLLFDAEQGSIEVYFVDFPDSWSQAARDLEDREYAMTSDWAGVLSEYQTPGWVSSFTLIDGLESVTIQGDTPNVLETRHLTFRLGVDTEEGAAPILVSSTIRVHRLPSL